MRLSHPTLLTECFLWYEVLRWWRLMMMDLYHQGRNVFNSLSQKWKGKNFMKWNGWDRKKERKWNEMMASLVVVMMRKYHQITDRHKGIEKTIGRKTVRNRHDFSILFIFSTLFLMTSEKRGESKFNDRGPKFFNDRGSKFWEERGFNQLQEQHQNISHDDLWEIETIKNLSLLMLCHDVTVCFITATMLFQLLHQHRLGSWFGWEN